MHNITTRLLGGFFAIILIFGLASLYITGKVNETSEESRQFVQEYWPTANLIMQARLSTTQMATQALAPPKGKQLETRIEEIKAELEGLRRDFAKSPLTDSERQQVDAQLELIGVNILAPMRQYTAPGEQMEAADAAVGPVLEKVKALGDVSLTNTLWEGVMAFNDILITRDPAERKRFEAQMQQVRRHPQFSAFSTDFLLFEQQALLVFDTAEQLYAVQSTFMQSADKLAATLAALEDHYEQDIVFPASKTILEHLASISKAIGIALLIGLLLSLSISLYLTRDIGTASRRVVVMIQSLAEGELYQRLKMHRKDEIGTMTRALNSTADRLSGMVARIGQVSSNLARTSSNISGVSCSVSQAADRQAQEVANTSEALLAIKQSMHAVGESVEELATATELAAQSSLEMSANIEETALNSEGLSQCATDASSSILEMVAAQRQIAESVQQLKTSSDTTLRAVNDTEQATRRVDAVTRETLEIVAAAERDALDGQQAVDKTGQGIDAISSASDSLFRNIENLKQKTDSIGSILTVIEDINSETSLLALNAAIIAAQAGSHGRAFSVVAEEIRDLAQRTGQSTEEIADIINGVQAETAQAVTSLDHAGESIRDGRRLSQQSGQALQKIVAGFRNVTLQMEQISAATGEQGNSSSVIQKTMRDVAGLIDQISIATGEQDKTNSLIQSITLRLQEMANHVRQSTGEQSVASKTIGRSTEDIHERIQRIRSACSRHEAQSQQVEQAVHQISASAQSNVAASNSLEEDVAELAAQMAVLHEEMQVFKLEPPAPQAG